MDEENNEFFDRAVKMMDGLRSHVGDDTFYNNVWIALISSTHCRNGVMNYLAKRLPQYVRGSALVYEPDMVMLARAFRVSILDKDIYVQRSALDLLMSSLPLRESAVPEAELVPLMSAALQVVLRRDMSLNKRLYNWLLGPQSEVSQQKEYFGKFGKHLAAQAIQDMLLTPAQHPTDLQKPLKILLSVQDKYDVGVGLAAEVIENTLYYIRDYVKLAEVSSVGSALLQAVELLPLWSCMNRLARSATQKNLMTLDTALSLCNLHEREAQHVHLPLMVVSLLCKSLVEQLTKTAQDDLLLLSVVSIRAFNAVPISKLSTWLNQDTTSTLDDHQPILAEIEAFYSDPKANPATHPFSFSWKQIDHFLQLLLCKSSTLVLQSEPCNTKVLAEFYKNLANMKAHISLSKSQVVDSAPWADQLIKASLQTNSFDVLEVAIHLLISEKQTSTLDAQLIPIMNKLWAFITPETTHWHTWIVKLIVELCQFSQDYSLFETVIAQHIVQSSTLGFAQAVDQIGVFYSSLDRSLWPMFTRPLFLLADRLASKDEEFQVFTVINKYRTNTEVFLATLECLLDWIVGSNFATEDDYNPTSWYSDPQTCFAVNAIRNLASHKSIHLFDFMRKYDTTMSDLLESRTTSSERLGSMTLFEAFFLALTRMIGNNAGNIPATQVTSRDQYLASVAINHFVETCSTQDVELLTQLQGCILQMLLKLCTHECVHGQPALLDLLKNVLSRLPPQESSQPLSSNDPFASNLTLAILFALTKQGNRPALLQWADFIQSTLERLSNLFIAIYLPIINRVCSELSKYEQSLLANRVDETHVIDKNSLITFVDILESVILYFMQDDSAMDLSTTTTDTFSLSLPFLSTSNDSSTIKEYISTQLSIVLGVIDNLWRCTSGDDTTTAHINSLRYRLTSMVRKFVNQDKKAVLRSMIDIWIHEDKETGQSANDFIENIQNVNLDDIVDVSYSSVRKDTPSTSKYIVFVANLLAHAKRDRVLSIVPRLLSFIRDMLNASARGFYPYLIRCCIVSWQKIKDMDGSINDRERLAEMFQVLIEGTCVEYGQQFVQIVKRRQSTVEKDTTASEFASEVLTYIANDVIPAIPDMSMDVSRINRILSTMIYHIVAPTLKANPLVAVSEYGLGLLFLLQISDIPSVYKLWKKDSWEAFDDSVFFSITDRRIVQLWKVVLNRTITHEKARVTEVIARLSWSSSALFSSREAEMALKLNALKRLSFLIYCGAFDQFLPMLPSIQQRIVDLLKLPTSANLIAEIYLCLRVLICRTSVKHLNSFWPVLITDMQQFFHQLETKRDYSPDNLCILLAMTKFLDLVLTISPDDFQIFRWMFVSENSPSEYAILERLAHQLDMDPTPTKTSLVRRPMLLIKKVSKIQDLAPFFSHISTRLRTQMILSPDMSFIDTYLEHEFFSFE